MQRVHPFERIILPNGLTVLAYQMKDVMSAFAALYVRVGAVYEKGSERGISHFTEHAALLGTKKYPSPLEISQTTQNLGATYDGWTDRFSTLYWVKLPHTNLKTGIDFLGQLVFEPLLNEESILKEKTVVLSEFNDFWQDPERRFEHETWRKRFKAKEHPYSYRSLGIPETIRAFDKKAVVDLRHKYYHPANMILSLAGNFEAEKLVPSIEKAFGKEKAGKKSKEPKFASDDYSPFSLYFQKEPRDQIYFILSFPAFGWREVKRKERLTLRLLNHILGVGPASRLFQRIREKERLVYRVSSNVILHPWMGALEIWGTVPKDKLLATMRIVMQEVENVTKFGVKRKEITLAKNFISASTLMRFDNPEAIAYFFGDQEFNEEEIWPPERYISEAEKITKGEIDALAKKIFDYKRVNINLLGNIPQKALTQIENLFRS